MNFRGQITDRKKNVFSRAIFPLVSIKKYFEALQFLLTKIIRQELIGGKTIDDPLINLALFAVFIIFSWLFYFLESYENIIFITFLVIWYLDFWLAQYNFLRNNKKTIALSLEKTKEKTFTWKTNYPNGDRDREIFSEEEVVNIFIHQHQVRGGSFEEVLGTVWRASITLTNQDELLLGEYKQVNRALKKAQLLANNLNAPIIFASSIGRGKYIAEELDETELLEIKAIEVKNKANKWQIASRWRGKEFRNLLAGIWQESGLILFVLIVSNLMFNFGKITNDFLNGNIIYFPSISNWFVPKFGLVEAIELALALGIMLFKGWQVSRKKRIYIDRDYLKFFLNNKLVGKIKTKEIESILLIDEITPTILILSPQKSLIISKFHSKAEYMSFLVKIAAVVDDFENPYLDSKS